MSQSGMVPETLGNRLNLVLRRVYMSRQKDRRDVDPDRFHDGTVRAFSGFSAQALRLKLVQIADAVITSGATLRRRLSSRWLWLQVRLCHCLLRV
jgi:hypothetical protein